MASAQPPDLCPECRRQFVEKLRTLTGARLAGVFCEERPTLATASVENGEIQQWFLTAPLTGAEAEARLQELEAKMDRSLSVANRERRH